MFLDNYDCDFQISEQFVLGEYLDDLADKGMFVLIEWHYQRYRVVGLALRNRRGEHVNKFLALIVKKQVLSGRLSELVLACRISVCVAFEKAQVFPFEGIELRFEPECDN